MATPREVLEAHGRIIRSLVEKNAALEARVGQLENYKTRDDGWDTPMIDPAAKSLEEAFGTVPAYTYEPTLDEPPVSMTVGGSTAEDTAAYKEFVEHVQKQRSAGRGLTTEGDTATLKAPTDQQKLMRSQLAGEIEWEHWRMSEQLKSPPLDEREASYFYIMGGPFWLVEYDRDWVMQQPMSIRQRMVQDAMLTDVESANELGADILKHLERNDPSVATDAAEKLMELEG